MLSIIQLPEAVAVSDVFTISRKMNGFAADPVTSSVRLKDRQSVPRSRHMLLLAIAIPPFCEPITKSTLRSCSSWRRRNTPTSTFVSVSMVMSSIWRPAMPPFSLTYLTAASVAFFRQ